MVCVDEPTGTGPDPAVVARLGWHAVPVASTTVIRVVWPGGKSMACENSVSLPFKARYTRQMREVALPGGNTTGAVLIDGVVHKRASPWTATVHAVLRHLEGAGFDAAPRALGFDDQGREMLTYLPGETIGDREPWPGWASADSMLVGVGRWLRRVHDLTGRPAGAVSPPASSARRVRLRRQPK